jgi:hypothetical protein
VSASPALDSTLLRTDLRRRLVRAWVGAWWGLLAGAALGAVGVGLWKLASLPPSSIRWLWIAAALAPLAGALGRGWKRSSRWVTARWLDEKHGLQQRLSTALDLSERATPIGGTVGAWQPLVARDAEAALADIRLARILPFQIPSMAWWAVGSWLVVLALTFVPPYQSAAQRQVKKDAGLIQEAGKELAGLVKRQLAQRPPAMEAPRRVLAETGELAARLSTAKLTRDDALKDLAKVTDDVHREALALQRNPALKKMAEAARSGDQGSESAGSTEQKKMEELRQKLGDMASQPEALQGLKKDMEKLQEAAKGVSGDNTPSAAAQREKLADQARQLAQKAAGMGAQMPSLEAAAQALSAAQVENFLKNLKTADMDLHKMAALSQALSEMKKQASESLGKDLAEQLKNGQVEAAVRSLEAIRKELAQGRMTPQHAAELSKALSPSKPYGKVPEKLQKALDQMKEGKAGEGEKSLAEAQKELKDLMDQLADAQAMEAAMASLQQAQMSIGNGMLWADSKNPGGTPSAGKAGKGGKGVGTWASSSAWSLPDQIDDLWDNSGVKRPDQAGKGQTDRDSNLPQGLVPTKIKGEMQPGGAMPSVTIKGLSIKGTSKVSYTEAVAAAQVDAQAALSQDQVPKAYQNSVRDYFDDFKK